MSNEIDHKRLDEFSESLDMISKELTVLMEMGQKLLQEYPNTEHEYHDE